MRKLIPLLALLASCTTAEHFKAAAYSAEVGYYEGKGELDFVRGTKDAEGDNYGFTISIHPFAWHAMKAQAEANARAATEAAYRAKMGLDKPCEPKPEPKPEPAPEAKPK